MKQGIGRLWLFWSLLMREKYCSCWVSSRTPPLWMRQKRKIMLHLFLHLELGKKKNTDTDNKVIISPRENPRVTTFCFRFTWNHNANLDFSVERYGKVDGWEFPKLIITRWRKENNSPLNTSAAVRWSSAPDCSPPHTNFFTLTVGEICLFIYLNCWCEKGKALSPFVVFQAFTILPASVWISYIFEAPLTPASQLIALCLKIVQEQSLCPWPEAENQRLKRTSAQARPPLIGHRHVREMHY